VCHKLGIIENFFSVRAYLILGLQDNWDKLVEAAFHQFKMNPLASTLFATQRFGAPRDNLFHFMQHSFESLNVPAGFLTYSVRLAD